MTSLAMEAVEAIASLTDTATFRATALRDMAVDSVVRSLPSFTAAKDAICSRPLVAERYGVRDVVGDRLTLQFVYQLFPRIGQQSVRQSARRVWRALVADLSSPMWVFRGSASLRDFVVEESLPDPVRLAQGVSIRGDSVAKLKPADFREMAKEVWLEDWDLGIDSRYATCVIHRCKKAPNNLLLYDAAEVVAKRAITCLRIAGPGDFTMGQMGFTRSGKFNVGASPIAGEHVWHIPAVATPPFVLTKRIARVAQNLQRALAHREENDHGREPGNLDLALRSFNSTYDRVPPRNDSQLLDSITAVEALLGTGTAELTFKLAFRVAGLLGRTTEERLQIFEAMKRFYDVRSKTVHGDNLKGKHLQVLQDVDDARDVVRRLLRGFIQLADSPAPTYNRDFFDQRLDAVLQDERARRKLLWDLGLSRT
jgi:hypothetical protein